MVAKLHESKVAAKIQPMSLSLVDGDNQVLISARRRSNRVEPIGFEFVAIAHLDLFEQLFKQPKTEIGVKAATLEMMTQFVNILLKIQVVKNRNSMYHVRTHC